MFFSTLTLAALMAANSYSPVKDAGQDIFIYSPGAKAGLHLAYLDKGEWHNLAQLCSSDYGPWGSDKNMYAPCVLQAKDGTWRAVWSVGDKAPCFAVAYSQDLMTWRPQDYPKVSAHRLQNLKVSELKDGSFVIAFQSDHGIGHVNASADFRTFVQKDCPEQKLEESRRDTLIIDKQQCAGQRFTVAKDTWAKVYQYYTQINHNDRLHRETMRDDYQRFSSLPSQLNATLRVAPSDAKRISDKLIGVFFEDINYAADGGLYGELLQNRDFEYSQRDHKDWSATTAWNSPSSIQISMDEPLSINNPHYVVAGNDSLSNSGWDGIYVQSGAKYDFSFFVRLRDVKQKKFQVMLVSADGKLLASEVLKIKGQAWTRSCCTLQSNATGDARFVLLPLGKGTAGVDMISLFPQDTYKGHGLRKDLAEKIAALHPKFMRFPGGCLAHGQGLDNIYHWSHSIGEWQDRKPDRNIWSYHQTMGLGYYEYFQFCEDIGAEPLPVFAAGVPCQNSGSNADGYAGQQGGIPMKDMPAYIDEILHMIEWANGDAATSEWAKKRADAGHPAPFHLKYIGIGNEDLISTTFEKRYEMICKAIREKYPDIQICGTVGPFHYPSSDYVEGWKFANEHRNLQDMVDEHYYESPGWFLHHLDYYDNYDRTAPKVYLGEYASKSRTQESALAEALYLCHVERNGDVVAMTSYAPLLCNTKHQNWNPDMIYFDYKQSHITPSYETQRIFGNYAGDEYITSEMDITDSLKYRVAASVVKDTKTNKMMLKLVNALPSAVTVSVDGMTLPQSAVAEGFTGNVTDKQVRTIQLTAEGQKITLPPYSVVALKW